MPPILVLPVLLLAAVVAAALLGTLQGGARSGDTYRPRGRGFGGGAGGAGLAHLVRRSELAGVRDAYSSAPIDAAARLHRCGQCLAMYHQSSVEVLKQGNNGRCAACGSRDIAPATVVDG